MKRAAALSAAFALLLALTWLMLRGVDAGQSAFADALQASHDVMLAEASLERDLLRARAGLLQNYDPLTRSLDDLSEAVSRLRRHAARIGAAAGPAERFAETIGRQEALTESFKSDNALLRNSLSYVSLLASRSGAGPAIASVILRLSLDTSPERVQAAWQTLDASLAEAPAGADQDALLAHARLLLRLLPAVDETLRALLAGPGLQQLDVIRMDLAQQQDQAERQAWFYRVTLYAVSLLLLGALVQLGLRLHASARALRRRAEFEHALARNSARLIDCPTRDTGARLQRMLGELAASLRMQRAYIVVDGASPRVHVWCADGAGLPPGWPDAAAALPYRLGGAEANVVTVADAESLQGGEGPEGEARRALAAASVRGWVCATLGRPGGLTGVLGFDSAAPLPQGGPPPELVRMAGDVVARALEREALERDRTRLLTRMERTRRVHTIGLMASGIAHNFNNIIGAILGYAEIAEADAPAHGRMARHLGEIRAAADRGRDLIDGILAFGRERQGQARPVPVDTLLGEAASLLRAALPGSIALSVTMGPQGNFVFGDAAQLQQVVLNLGTNASQAMNGDGVVRLVSETRLITARQSLSHGELAPGRYVRLSVHDRGCGIDAATAQRIFEPFFTTRRAGTGLGLATVREIVRDHDGALHVHSVPGQGSRFEVWLPAEPALPPGPDATKEPAPPVFSSALHPLEHTNPVASGPC